MVERLRSERRSLKIMRITIGAVMYVVRVPFLLVRDDVRAIRTHLRLFLGLVLVTLGLLNMASDRYCDGNASAYYNCTRPATYYFYPWWAILLTVAGTILIALWVVRRGSSHIAAGSRSKALSRTRDDVN